MAYINQDKNLKLFIIEPNGNVICTYDGEFDGKLHYEVLLETIKNKLAYNKKLVKKADKKAGANMELIRLMLDNGYILMYDTTNYNNYHKYKDHTGIIMLPKKPNSLVVKQKISLLKLLKELPLNLNSTKYSEEFHLPYVTYSLLQSCYMDKYGKFSDIGSIDLLINALDNSKLGDENLKNKGL